MRVLFWFCDRFGWKPSFRSLEQAPEAGPGVLEKVVVAFVQVEPQDVQGAGAETKLVKNAKWLARKWETSRVLLHSFSHLGERKAEPAEARALLDRAEGRLNEAGYTACQTPYGYFNDLEVTAPGHPLARIYKEW